MAADLDQIRRLIGDHQLSPAVQAALDWFSGSEPLTVAEALGGALRPLITTGQGHMVTAFLKQLGSFIDPPVVEAIRRGLDQAPADTVAWAEKLPVVTQERLARECRDAIRLKQFPIALERAKLILAYRIGEQDVSARAQLLGSVLGSLENMPREVDALWGMIEAQWTNWGIPETLKQTVVSGRKARLDSIGQRRYETSETEWSRLLTELSLSLKGDLPRPNQMGEASDEDIAKFHASALGLVNAALASPRHISMPDAMWILVEYTPKQTAATAQRAGIEQRIHGTLGPRAQQAVTEGFRRLGAVEGLRSAVLDAAKSPPFDRYRDMALDLMAALERPEFSDVALGVLRDKSLVAHHMNAITVLGACGGAKALDLIFETLKANSGRVIDGNERRVVIKCLDAMDRVIRRNSATGPERDALLEKIIRAIPRDDTRLLMGVASRLCLFKVEDLSPSMQDWAVKQLIGGLWRPDTTPTFARPTDVEQVRRRPLGQRQGLVNALIRVGEHALAPLHAFVMGADARVSGAYVAAAEILAKIKSPTSVSPLEAMLRTVLLAKDEELSGAYTEEQYFDEEAGRMESLSRDKIAGSILEALRAIGTPEALEILWRLRHQVEMNQVPSLGKHTATVLSTLPPAPDSLDLDAEKVVLSQADEGPHTADLIADLRTGGFLGFGADKARVKKIAALQALSKRLALEALEPMTGLLADKDALVRASAKTAILGFAAPSAPKAIREAFVDFVLSELADGRSPARDALLGLLRDVNTTVEPWASRIDALLATNPTGALRAALANLRRSAGGYTASDIGDETTAKASAALSKLELKRQYLDARRAWIAGGKKGPPPEAPEGIDLG